MVPDLNAIYSAGVGIIPLLYMLRLRIKMRKGKASSPYAVACDGDGSPASADGSADRSIAALVDAACAGADGVSASQREFAAKMISGLGYATEAAFAREVGQLDWGRHCPGFPCRVELLLKLHFAAAQEA